MLAFQYTPSRAADGSPNKRFSIGEPLDETFEPTRQKSDEEMFHYNQNEWNQMRRVIEGEAEPAIVSVSSPTVSASSSTANPPKPPPGLLNVDLPYESSLSITGRKVIRLDIQNNEEQKI
jgi:hypothetical protein